MCNPSSRNLVLWPFFLIFLLVLSFSLPAEADSTNVPWLSGSFSSSGSLFSVGGTWQDYQWSLELSPNLPDMTVTWSCDVNYCEGWSGGAFTGGTAYGQIWSLSLNSLLYTFSGEILTGGAFREAGHCVVWDQCPSYTFDQYDVNFRGQWSNGWYTVGDDFATDFESDWNGSHQSDVLGFFDMATSTPEPATLTLMGVGLAGVYVRTKRR
jgi:PEP-CTERM motif-containing protein